MKLPETENITKGLYLIGGLIMLFIVYKVMTGLGLIKTGQKKREDYKKETSLSDLRTMEQFNPSYKDTNVFTKVGLNFSNDAAEKLHKAIRGIGTDEESIYTTFATFKNKGTISEVASQYLLKFKRDLRTDILNELTKKEVPILMDIINTLPNT